MDPVSVISLATSIAGLIDITSRSIAALLSLKSRYSRFGLKISQIAGQLSTLKAALKKIKDLIEINHDNILRKGETQIFALDDEQLVFDLVLSIDCCESVIKVLDEQLSRFQPTSPSQLSGLSNVRTKVKFLWEEGDLDDYQGMLNHQINALNLLLTVTRCESFMEQRNLLRRESSRQVFEQVKDDTSFLLLQRDKDSFLSRQSSAIDDIDFIDTEFGFERDLFSSKAYRSVARSWMRQSILSRKKQNSSTIITAAAPQVNESDSIVSDTSTPVMPHNDKSLIHIMTHTSIALEYSPMPEIPEHPSETQDLKRSLKVPILDTRRLQMRSPRPSVYVRFARRVAPPPSVQPVPTLTDTTPAKSKFLLLGTSASGKSTAMKAIHHVQSRFHEYPSPTRLESIERLVCMIEEDFMDKMFKPESRPQEIEALREQCEKVRESLRKAETQSLAITDTPPIREQLMELLVETRGLAHKLPLSVLERGDYDFLKAIDRVTQDDYTPSFEDTLWNYAKTTGIHEISLQGHATRYIPDSQEVKIVDIGGRRSERRKWIRAFGGVSAFFFFVDISGYDETLAEDQEDNKMQESFSLFNSLCKSTLFAHTPITIIFHYMDRLERKIAEGRYPNIEYESDEEDLCTVDGVRDYFTRRFLELDNRSVEQSTSVHYTSIYELDKLGDIFLQHTNIKTPMHYP